MFKKRHNKPNKKASHRLHPEYIKNSYNQQGKCHPVEQKTKDKMGNSQINDTHMPYKYKKLHLRSNWGNAN